MTEGTRFIRLNSSLQLDTLTIIMDNSFSGPLNMENGTYRSSKRDDFGVGLTSIQAVAHKCGGGSRFKPEDQVFHSSVYVTL